MNGKGDTVRPRAVSQQEWGDSFARTFPCAHPASAKLSNGHCARCLIRDYLTTTIIEGRDPGDEA